MKYVIIGNSAAGIGAVEGIRKVDKQGEITIVSDERHFAYSRPLISYYLLGKVTEQKMKYRQDNFYTDHNCSLLSGYKATQVNAEEKYIVLDNERTIPYDRLLVATGSSPFIPTIKGLEKVENYFTFTSLHDAQNLNSALKNLKRVLIIGAGLIGLKCAEGIAKRVAHVTVVDIAPRILSSILDENGAKIVQSHLEKNGIIFQLSCGVQEFGKDYAVLSNGKTIPFDLLIMAVGVRPNTSLLNGIAKIDRGIIVDEASRTSAKDIYAAGDCTQTLDISSGQNKVLALLPNAYMQGECAGINMAGGQKTFDQAIPMNAIGFFGLHTITAGTYNGEVYNEIEENSYKCLFYSNNRLNGYILIGGIEKAGIYTRLIREQTPLDCIDFDLICKKPGLMAWSKKDRTEKLGGQA